ncbi:MAG: DHH family phosphoesterase [Bacteroidia bacterium]|nr:DHH family phosphoesterase [Bacteroidia bacterium]
MMANILSKYNVAGLEKAINEHNTIILTCHVNADGDALGSTLGLQQVLVNMGKKCSVIVPDLPPTNLSWIQGFKTAHAYEREIEACDSLIEEADCIFIMDYNAFSRAKLLGEKLASIDKASKCWVMVDHHLDPVEDCDVKISDPTASATCEVIFNCLFNSALKEYIDVKAASCFYTGIITDTGGLSYNSSNPDLYLLVAELLRFGIDKESIHDKIFNNKSVRRLKLLAASLKRMIVIGDTNVAYIGLPKNLLDKYHYMTGDTEGFVNVPLQAKNVQCSILLMDRPDGVKASLRSKGNFSVSDFAQKYYGGGGHFNASGATLNMPFEEAEARIIADMQEYFNTVCPKTNS